MSSSSDVRDIDALERLRVALDDLANRLSADGHSIRATVRHAQRHFSDETPQYWRDQIQIAERQLAQADLRLRNKRCEVRPGDASPATEELKQVNRWRARLRLCHEKLQACRRVSLEMDQAADKFMGPIIRLIEQAGSDLPEGVAELTRLIDQLHRYRES